MSHRKGRLKFIIWKTANMFCSTTTCCKGDQEEEDYNADQEIHLRAFPHITMTLGEIFEDID